jgi:hypothetical protein
VPQSVRLEKNRCNFTLSGDDVRPAGREWWDASPARRRRYWELLRGTVYDIKVDALANALDARGKKIRKVKPESREPYRRAGLEWKGPGLMPQRELSRTRRYFRVMVYPQGNPSSVIGYWLNKWSVILGYHARGEVKGAPIRNVVGLSDKQVAKAVQAAIEKWRSEAPPARVRAQRAASPPRRQERPLAAKPERRAKPRPPAAERPLTPQEQFVANRYPEIGKYLRPPRPRAR